MSCTVQVIATDHYPGAMGERHAVERIDAALVRLVRRVTDARTTAMVNEWAGVEVERSGFVLLARIEELPDARLAELAEAADVDVSTASRQVARLVEQELVTRSPDPCDHRALLHRLSPRGADALARLRRARRRWIDEITAGFSPSERAAFAELFERFVDRLHEVTPAGDG